MICFVCKSDIHIEMDILNMFQKPVPLCERCKDALLEKTETDYERPHDVQSFLDYNKSVADLFHRYKFMGDYALCEVIANIVQFPFGKYDYVIPVPLSTKRLKERGYNQVTAVLDYKKIKYKEILETAHRKRQSEMTKRERQKSHNPFTFKEDFDVSNLADKRILIIDDIYTTGMTMTHCIEVVSIANPCEIDVLTFSKV